jgi:hypothetical protein
MVQVICRAKIDSLDFFKYDISVFWRQYQALFFEQVLKVQLMYCPCLVRIDSLEASISDIFFDNCRRICYSDLFNRAARLVIKCTMRIQIKAE